jgi:transposase
VKSLLKNPSKEMLMTLEKEQIVDLFLQFHAMAFARISELEQQVKLLQKALYGDKKESHKPLNPSQISLSFIEDAVVVEETVAEYESVSYKRKKPKKERVDFSKLSFPEELERVETVIEPEGKSDDMVKIGEERTELLAIVPEKFYVKVIVRPKYINKKESDNTEASTVIIAPLPTRAIAGGKIDTSFLVRILCDKYLDHLPLYRQIKRYERLGMKLSDATIGHWVHQGLKLLEYLYEELIKQVKKCTYLQADETTIKVLDPDKPGTTHRGYYWVYHSVESGLVLYEYHDGRGKNAGGKFIRGYKGYLQSDGLQAYKSLAAESDDIIHICCMAHARRKFFEAEDGERKQTTWMLSKIQELYEIERYAREQNYTTHQRFVLRQEKALPILDEMKQWCDAKLKELWPTNTVKKAIVYMLNHWSQLHRYCSDGRLEIDNNGVENAIRPVALGRKNYLFAGSHDAAQRAAVIYSLFATCKKNNIEPYAWLEKTLDALPDTTTSQLHKLLPINNQDGVQ